MIAGCSSGVAPTNQAPSNQATSNASAVASPKNNLLGDEPATSPSAEAAKQVVTQYFALIDAGKYDDAYHLWGNGGADVRGTLKQFTDGIRAYSVYDAKVGEPTAIKSREGKQYILVTATLDVKLRRTGGTAARSGTVMLSRSADPKETAPDKKEWRIWGMDLRVKH